ncbi:HK97 gp10 family phage protein [Pseudomonas sp. JUb42]|uniref:HK97-gp10 family putative phage morphogenesis protein n=1 Tax=Pseudomonas sp. JUb42 TaxID=2940611 RepID=UPI002168C1CC|nr:HK97-gp10 family putative phage morphogenesis protein [Pseudomonas sp. JUb42]MCS3467398.1 HK97 gp10 family phage protein [Pseudomonas sp. JUb42]
MAEISIQLLGLDDLKADFERLAKATGDKIVRDAVMAGARLARDKVRQAAPVRTRKLQKNITVTRARQSETPGGATAGIRVKKPSGKTTRPLKRKSRPGKRLKTEYAAPFYWKFLELGTSNMRAHPFIRPTWDGSLSQIEQRVREKLVQGIDSAIIG